MKYKIWEIKIGGLTIIFSKLKIVAVTKNHNYYFYDGLTHKVFFRRPRSVFGKMYDYRNPFFNLSWHYINL